jgi:peptide chain release factor 2
MNIDTEKLQRFQQGQKLTQEVNLNDKLGEIEVNLRELQEQASKPDFWSNTDKARDISTEIGNLENEKKEIARIKSLESDVEFMIEQVNQGEQSYLDDLHKYLDDYDNLIQQFKLKTFLSGKYDINNAIFSIFAGQGGTEANDWADMLMRMYLRFFAAKGWETEIIDKTPGSEVGISSVTIKVIGRYAYGYCKVEHGTHRLVRVSPFNAQGLRQTSFAGVEVTPSIENEKEVEIKPEEIEFSAVRSAGAGGQNVNKVATSVRIRHIPTGIVVTCSTARTQLANKKQAMEMLAGKLAILEEEKVQSQINQEKGETFKASWGRQIRNYVLHPYKLVKDLRTQVETDKVETVLDGDLEKFVNAGIIFLSTK